jgi:polar amino acid transport system substrate-binding protein
MGGCRQERRRALVCAVMSAALLCACSAALPPTEVPRSAAAAELAPDGRLRAAINFGNPVLATRDAATGEPRGVSVDLARELGRRLGVPVTLVTFEAAGKVVDAAKSNVWDIAFVAIDPVRTADMDQTAPYVIIEGVYLVAQTSPVVDNTAVDRDDVRIVVATGSAYDLYLTRELKHAKLVRVPASPLVVDTMRVQKLDVAAGVRQQLEFDARRVGDVRVLPGRFMVIEQAMAMPKNRPAGARYLREFVEEVKASGFVARSLERNGIQGAAVAPPAPR